MVAPPPRLQLALAPTPILKLDRLSRRLGVEIHVKRDDLTGLATVGAADFIIDMSESVVFDRREDVAVLTIDNPPVNALAEGVRDALLAGVERANADLREWGAWLGSRWDGGAARATGRAGQSTIFFIRSLT